MNILISIVLLFGSFLVPTVVDAHHPVVEPIVAGQFKNEGFYFRAIKLEDPTQSSLAVYGSLNAPDEYDLYAFVPAEDATIPLELLVPISNSNKNFKPSVFVIAKDLQERTETILPFEIPKDYQVLEIKNLEDRSRIFYEPFAAERYYQSEQKQLVIQKGKNYFLAVMDTHQQNGDYALGLGTKENFSDVSFPGLIKNVVTMKLGLAGNPLIPWTDLAGLFLLLAGFVIGLGSVTVIDIHGFLGTRSGYWNEATIRTHKITKPLIWVGFMLVLVGGSLFFRESWLNGVVFFQALLFVMLLFNALFLTFWVSPRLIKREDEGRAQELLPSSWQKAITVSFLLSFVGWWGRLGLLVWYLIMQR
ncbi:MAG: hypothetical protein M3Q64_03095 [bacterium]|nr:hypothetical protein [bacterium]